MLGRLDRGLNQADMLQWSGWNVSYHIGDCECALEMNLGTGSTVADTLKGEGMQRQRLPSIATVPVLTTSTTVKQIEA